MSVYSNRQIKQAIKKGSIMCIPFRPEHLNLTSLDMTLGYFYFRVFEQTKNSIQSAFSNKDSTHHFDGPHRAVTHQEWCRLNGLKPVNNIPLDHPVISIGPKELLLTHTHEFFGVLSPDVAEVRALANWRHNGIIINSEQSWIESNQFNRHTLELYNTNERETVLLPVGERIARIVFWHQTSGSIADEAYTAQEWDIDPKIALGSWAPEDLLPKRRRM